MDPKRMVSRRNVLKYSNFVKGVGGLTKVLVGVQDV